MKNIVVLQFPGTNCDLDTQYAFEKLGCQTTILWHKETNLPEKTDLIVIPGGFSYGDYLRSGAIAQFSPIMESVIDFANKGGKVLGICNGFQILTEVGLLPGALKRNVGLHFISKIQTLKIVNNSNDFLQKCTKDEILNIPIAHADGNYYIDEEGYTKLEANEQILVRYCDKKGEPIVVNGSVTSIAGVCNTNKNVFGLMPHPERALENILGSDDGIKMLEGLIA